MNITSGINRIKLAAALTLMCSVFGLTAMAQTNPDKPLDAKAVAALVGELKEIVSRTSPDANDAAMVARKWDARQDLAGKTRKDVINLLYADAKSVIKDSGVLYQLYAMFSFYKTIPGEMQPVQLGETIAPSPKSASVKTLIELTYRMHPYVGIEEQLASLPGTKDIKAAEEEDRKNRIAGFDEALKVNNKLTPAQKSFVRANYDQLIKIADKITEDAIKTNFPTEQWIKEGLQKSYTSRFTQPELNMLIVYFQGADGQPVLKYIRISQMAQMITGNGGTLNFTAADKAEHDKFIATPLGKKFMTAYLREATDYEKSKVNAAMSKIPNADGFAIYEPENLNKLFNKFVADNYRK
jgi:hypothetical protein